MNNNTYEYYKGFKVKRDNLDRFIGMYTTFKLINKYKEYISKYMSKSKIIYFTNQGQNLNIHQLNGTRIDLHFNNSQIEIIK